MNSILFLVFAFKFLQIAFSSAAGKLTPSESGCSNEWTLVECKGNFNFERFLNESALPGFPLTIKIVNTSVSHLNFTAVSQEVEVIVIENAPNLTSISFNSPKLKNSLKHFRAVRTQLDPAVVNTKLQFSRKLLTSYVGSPSRCPEDEGLFHPCKCKSGFLPLTTPFGSAGYSWSRSELPTFSSQVTCESDALSGEAIKSIFQKVSSSNESKQYDVLTISGKGVASLPANFFSDLQFTSVWFEGLDNLRYIHGDAFGSQASAQAVQILDIKQANFTALNGTGVESLFSAFRALRNVRVLRCIHCGIPNIPDNAFGLFEMSNLRIASFSLDRKFHTTGIKTIGSHAFGKCPNLELLGLYKGFIDTIEPYAFYLDDGIQVSSTTPRLTVELGMNPVTTLKPSSLTTGARSLDIKWNVDSFSASDPANYPQFDVTDEQVFGSFLRNGNNSLEVDHHNLEVECSCNARWMFDSEGILLPSVRNGIQIKRATGNTIANEFVSIQCSFESNFTCLPPCLVFPKSQLLHCSGPELGDLNSTFTNIFKLILEKNVSINTLKFAAKRVKTLEKDAFGGLQLQEIYIHGAEDLTTIKSDAFSSSVETLKILSIQNSSLETYPDFSIYPNLERIYFDETRIVNFSTPIFKTGPKSRNVRLQIYTGHLSTETFANLGNQTNVTLLVGKNRECDTMGCYINCEPSPLQISSKWATELLTRNKHNKIISSCYQECDCAIEWMHNEWELYRPQIQLWMQEYIGDHFFCAPKGENVTSSENFFGIDFEKFKIGGEYFKESCQG